MEATTSTTATFAVRVCGEIARLLLIPPARVVADATLAEDLGVDSLLYMTMVVGLEQHFDVILPDQEAARLTRVADVIEAFRAHVAAEADR
jgi:acyl carrier protein